MEYVVKLLFRTHLYLILIVAISYIIEKVTGLILLTTAFTETKKNAREARATTDFFASLYLAYQLAFYFYEVNTKSIPENLTFWKWLLACIPMTVLFWKVYHKYQGHETSTNDIDD